MSFSPKVPSFSVCVPLVITSFQDTFQDVCHVFLTKGSKLLCLRSSGDYKLPRYLPRNRPCLAYQILFYQILFLPCRRFWPIQTSNIQTLQAVGAGNPCCCRSRGWRRSENIRLGSLFDLHIPYNLSLVRLLSRA